MALRCSPKEGRFPIEKHYGQPLMAVQWEEVPCPEKQSDSSSPVRSFEQFGVLLCLWINPNRRRSDNQDAGGDRKQRSRSTELVCFSELRKVLIAWAAGAEVIEPFLGFRERHRSRRDSLENVRARTSAALRIRKLFEQTSAQRIQDALFVSRGISLFVQACLPLRTLPTTARIYIQLTSAGLLRLSSFEQSHNVPSSFFQPVLEFHLRLLLRHAQPGRNLFP